MAELSKSELATLDRLIGELEQAVQIAEWAKSTIYPEPVNRVAEDMRTLLGTPSTLPPMRPAAS